MDRKAGYKECSRCGLRNKPSALQCDFCGLRFIAGEDWDDNIQALEKMGDSEEGVLVDEDVSKRIEATIVKRDKINAPIKAKEPVRESNDHFDKQPEPARNSPAPIVIPSTPTVTVMKASVVEAKAEPLPEPEPVQAAPAPERITIPERPPTVAVPVPETVPEPKREPRPVREKKMVRRVVRTTPKVFTPVKNTMRRTALTAVLALGVIWYFVALIWGDNTLGRAGGWTMVAFSSMMVVVGSVGLFVPKTSAKAAYVDAPSPERKSSNEVLICPTCHERVKSSDNSCPDCGAEFRSE